MYFSQPDSVKLQTIIFEFIHSHRARPFAKHAGNRAEWLGYIGVMNRLTLPTPLEMKCTQGVGSCIIGMSDSFPVPRQVNARQKPDHPNKISNKGDRATMIQLPFPRYWGSMRLSLRLVGKQTNATAWHNDPRPDHVLMGNYLKSPSWYAALLWWSRDVITRKGRS